MKSIIAFAAAASLGALSLRAGVENVVVSQSSPSEVVIAYDLTGTSAAIVTIDVTTNGVSVGGAHLRTLSGAVNRLVQPGTGLVARWKAYKDLLGNVETATVKAVVTAWDPSTPPDYMIVDLQDSESTSVHEYYADIEAIPLGFSNNLYKTAKMIFRRVPAAGVTFRMGSASNEANRNANREIPHHVLLTNDFWLGIYTMTRGQYNTLVNGTVSTVSDPFQPKIIDTGYDTVRGADPANAPSSSSILGTFKARTGLDADLPTDAEFEFAHRAGVEGPIVNPEYTYANNHADTKKIDWWGESTLKEVGLLEPNRWYFYDMGGNSANYVKDYYADGDNYRNTFGSNYTTEPVVAPLISTDIAGNQRHVARGGRYNMDNASNTRPAHRYWIEGLLSYASLRIAVPIH